MSRYFANYADKSHNQTNLRVARNLKTQIDVRTLHNDGKFWPFLDHSTFVHDHWIDDEWFDSAYLISPNCLLVAATMVVM